CSYLPLFFVHHSAAIHICPLSLHDALPISRPERHRPRGRRVVVILDLAACGRQLRPHDGHAGPEQAASTHRPPPARRRTTAAPRSEEHTSELQSRENLVCRLLLEKKKN